MIERHECKQLLINTELPRKKQHSIILCNFNEWKNFCSPFQVCQNDEFLEMQLCEMLHIIKNDNFSVQDDSLLLEACLRSETP